MWFREARPVLFKGAEDWSRWDVFRYWLSYHWTQKVVLWPARRAARRRRAARERRSAERHRAMSELWRREFGG